MSMRLLLSLVALVLAACAAGPAAAPAQRSVPASDAGASAQPGATASPDATVLQPSEGFARSKIAFVGDGRRVTMPVLVADTTELRSVGLMRREDLPDDAGMIFVYEEDTQSTFWMMDTLLPLTIAFVGDDGVVQQLTDMDPCTVDDCPSYAAEQPYRYAIEANQGYYDRNGITPGWTLEVPDAIGRTS